MDDDETYFGGGNDRLTQIGITNDAFRPMAGTDGREQARMGGSRHGWAGAGTDGQESLQVICFVCY